MSKIKTPNSSKALATLCAKLSIEKIAIDVLIMELLEYETAPADYFVICTSESSTQSKAILDYVLRQSKNVKVPKPKVEGEANGD